MPILFGSDQLQRGTGPRYYNAAFLLGADGARRAVYRKIQPGAVRRVLPTPAAGCRSFRRSSRRRGAVRRGVVGRDAAARDATVRARRSATRWCSPSWRVRPCWTGSELLTTITNDGWYGQSSAPYQHFGMASMRAIEQGRYLARAANTGISGIVDPYGRVVQRSASSRRRALSASEASSRAGRFTRAWATWLPWGCAGPVVAAMLGARRASRQPRADAVE